MLSFFPFNQDLTLCMLGNCTVFIMSNPKLTLYVPFMLLTLFALTFYLREIIIQIRSGSNFRTASFMTLAHAICRDSCLVSGTILLLQERQEPLDTQQTSG